MASSTNLDAGAQLIVEECTTSYSLPPMPDIKVEHQLDTSTEEGPAQSVTMGMKFILPNRFDMNVCSRFVKSLNEEDSKNIQDQVNSDLEVASVLFKAECNSHASPSPGIQVRHVYTPSTTKHFSPIKQSTTLTNKHRGNEVSTTPLLVNSLSVHQLAAQGEMLYLATRIEQGCRSSDSGEGARKLLSRWPAVKDTLILSKCCSTVELMSMSMTGMEGHPCYIAVPWEPCEIV
uniref:Ankyrin repeat family A member 2 n=1 Tax=Taeniopygia guttata TaxID=59729 RepID=H0Z661_TAEGU